MTSWTSETVVQYEIEYRATGC